MPQDFISWNFYNFVSIVHIYFHKRMYATLRQEPWLIKHHSEYSVNTTITIWNILKIIQLMSFESKSPVPISICINYYYAICFPLTIYEVDIVC